MTETFDMRTALAKAARIALVFMLVFYTSLRVEFMVAVAYAAGHGDVDVEKVGPEESDELEGILAYQSEGSKWTAVKNAASALNADEAADQGGVRYFAAKPQWTSTKGEEKDEYSTLSVAEAPSWKVDGNSVPADRTVAGDFVESSVDGNGILQLTPKKAGAVTVTCEVEGKTFSFTANVSAPTVTGVTVEDPTGGQPLEAGKWEGNEFAFTADVAFSNGTIVNADDLGKITYWTDKLEWSVEPVGDSPSGGASIVDGVLTIEEAGTYTVTCTAVAAQKSATATVVAEKAADDGAEKVSPEVEVWLTSSDEPALGKGDSGVELTRSSESDEFSYQLVGHVRIYTTADDGATEDTEELLLYSTEDGSLNEKTKALEKEKNITGVEMNDVEWSLTKSNEPAGDISGGLLRASEDGTYKVTCRVTPAGESSSEWPASADITCKTDGKDLVEDDEDLHLDDLTVTANVPVSAVSADKLKELGEESSSGDKVIRLEGDGQVLHYAADGSGNLNTLATSESTYDMYSLTKGQVEIAGKGATLESVLGLAGIADMSAVQEVKFVNYKDETVVSWSKLASGSAPMVAFESNYVNSGDGSAGEQGLLPNDRFHILYDMGSSTEVDADSLRWIKEIVVNPKAEITGGGDEDGNVNESPAIEDDGEKKDDGSENKSPVLPDDPVAPFTVSVDAAWAPYGEAAVLNPDASIELEGTFDFYWEGSTDGGKTWKQVYEGQTYRVTVTDANAGNLVRVRVHNSNKDPQTGKDYEAVSKPVALQIKEGFIVQLEYDPPEAGDVALFQVKIIDTVGDVDKSNLDFVWEVSEDGKKTWQKLASKYQGGSTLKIPTQLIDEGEVDSSGNKIAYIRCTAVEKTGQMRSRTTNSQPFTVRAHNSEAAKKKKAEKAKGGDDVETIYSDTDNDKDTDTNANGNGSDDVDEPTVGDVNADNVEAPVTDETSEGTGEVPDNYQPIDMSQIDIDSDVTEQVIAQDAAAQAQVEATVPGARWTKISAAQGDDVANVLSNNPFAPFAIPTGLGVTVAGGLEKLLSFRRQLK